MVPTHNTAFRRLSKWLPLSPEVRDAFDKDDDVPRDITASVRASSPLARVELPDAGGETKEAAPTEPDAPFAVDTPDAAPTTPDAPAEDDDDIPY
jgi:recombinational DNA repair protein RecT